MKIVVIGPTLLTRRCLEALLKRGEDEIVAVFALKNEYAPGKARFAVFDDLARNYGFKLYKVDNINAEKNVEIIKKIRPDLILELGWSQIISGGIIKIPKKGCVGVHAAMLPKNRGGASLNWALIKGEKDWGISLYYMDEKIDTGKIIGQKKLKVDKRDTITTLHEKSDIATIELLMENLPLIRKNKVKIINQSNHEATFLSSRKPIEGHIIWNRNAKEIYNLIRGLSGDFPGAFTFFNDKKLFIWDSETAQGRKTGVKPGKIIGIPNKKGVLIQTGKGALLIKRAQVDGDVPMWADDLAKKYTLRNENTLGNYHKFPEDTKKWLINSGIQNTEGAFNAWYDLKTKTYSYLYSEITGYGITALLYLNNIKRNQKLTRKAEKAAEWLTRCALLECGGFLTRNYLNTCKNDPEYSFDSGVITSFDVGMVLFGMVNLYKQTKKEKYLKTARKTADFLLAAQRENGLFEPSYNAKTKKFTNTDKKWSTQSGSFHNKIAMGMLNLYDITKEKKYKDSAIKICDASLKFQKADGRFVTSKNTDSTHLHPHCYSCEGLYYAGKKLKNSAYLKAALKGTVWALKSPQKAGLRDGGIPCIYDKKIGFDRNQRTDILAQTLRLSLYFLNDGEPVIKDLQSNVYDLASKLLSFQKTDGDQTGGFYFGWENDKKLPHINSWCSMFALQALYTLEDYLNNREVNTDFLI